MTTATDDLYGPIVLGIIAHGADRLRKPTPNNGLVDTLRVTYRVHSHNSSSNTAEQNGKCVTHVSGQKCYPCCRLLRPHQALGNDTPAKHYAVSPRRFDGILREPNYGADHAIRRVRHNGEIRWQGNTVYISAALIGEPVGLIENDNGDWTISYGPIVLGIIAHGADRLAQTDTPNSLWTCGQRCALPIVVHSSQQQQQHS